MTPPELSSSTPARPVRRSARTPAKPPAKAPVNTSTATTATSEAPAQSKQKPRAKAEKSPAEKLDYLLTNPKSKLTKIDISDVVNYPNFLELSEDAQKRLCALLPPTAFSTYVPSVCPTHPDYAPAPAEDGEDRMQVDDTGEADAAAAARSPATLDPAVFSSLFFLSAAHTFQDHLFSSWLGKKASDDLANFEEAARTGSMHADWKDEVWERNHQPVYITTTKGKLVHRLDMSSLANHGLLQEGDILAYKREFPTLNITVEKDVLVDSINPQTHSTSFLLSPGVNKSLPSTLLIHGGTRDCDTKMLSIEDITDPVALERGVLDVDARVRPSDKYAGDAAACAASPDIPGRHSEELENVIAVRAWKAFTVWRWREEMRGDTAMQLLRERGGREKVATLFYLRGCCS